MSSRPVTGQTCTSCRTELNAASANCPSCGKLDMSRLRMDAARAFLPGAAFAAVIFGALAGYTAYVKGPDIASGLASHIDDQFKPAVVKKK